MESSWRLQGALPLGVLECFDSQGFYHDAYPV